MFTLSSINVRASNGHAVTRTAGGPILGYVRWGQRNGETHYLWSEDNAAATDRAAWRSIGLASAFPSIGHAVRAYCEPAPIAAIETAVERSDCPAERDFQDAARVKAESALAHGFKRGQNVRIRDGYEFGGSTRFGEVVTQLHGSQPSWSVRCEFGGVVHYLRPDGIELAAMVPQVAQQQQGLSPAHLDRAEALMNLGQKDEPELRRLAAHFTRVAPLASVESNRIQSEAIVRACERMIERRALMVPQPVQQQQARARAPKPVRGERRYVAVRDTETGEVHRVLTSIARVGVAVVIFTPSNRHREGALGGMLITHDDRRKAWVFNDEAEARRCLSSNNAPGERIIRAELVADPAPAMVPQPCQQQQGMAPGMAAIEWAPELLEALQGVLPYAESRLEDMEASCEAAGGYIDEETHKARLAIEAARQVIVHAKD